MKTLQMSVMKRQRLTEQKQENRIERERARTKKGHKRKHRQPERKRKMLWMMAIKRQSSESQKQIARTEKEQKKAEKKKQQEEKKKQQEESKKNQQNQITTTTCAPGKTKLVSGNYWYLYNSKGLANVTISMS